MRVEAQSRRQSTAAFRPVLVATAIGVAGSLVIVPLSYLQVFLGLVHVCVLAATHGLWFVPCVLPMIVVRRPGASIVACLAMGVICSVTSPFGPAAIGTLLLEGLLVEVPFMVTLYRRWSVPQFVFSAILFALLLGGLSPRAIGVESPGIGMTVASVVVALASCLVALAGCLHLGKRLRASGVVD